MSSFGSAVINKSNKKFAPKAPTQKKRPAASATSQTELTLTKAPEPARQRQQNHDSQVIARSDIESSDQPQAQHKKDVTPPRYSNNPEDGGLSDLHDRPSKRRRLEDEVLPPRVLEQHDEQAAPGTADSNIGTNQESAWASSRSGKQPQSEVVSQNPNDTLVETSPGAQNAVTAIHSNSDPQLRKAATTIEDTSSKNDTSKERELITHGNITEQDVEIEATNPTPTVQQKPIHHTNEQPTISQEIEADTTPTKVAQQQNHANRDTSAEKNISAAPTDTSEDVFSKSNHIARSGQSINGRPSSEDAHTTSGAMIPPSGSPIFPSESNLAQPDGINNMRPEDVASSLDINVNDQQVESNHSESISPIQPSTQTSTQPPVESPAELPVQTPLESSKKKTPSKTSKSKKPKAARETVAESPSVVAQFDSENVSGVAASTTSKKTKPRKPKETSGQNSTEIFSGTETVVPNVATLAKKARKPRRKGPPNTPRIAVDQDDDTTAENPPSTVTETAGTGDAENEGPQRKRPGRKRAVTPEGAENIEIDVETTTMFDLCKDKRQGRKSQREAELQNIDWTEVIKKRKAAEARARAGEIDEREREESDRRKEAAERQKQGPRGPQLRLINGQMILDTDSLVVNRHAGIDMEDMDAVEENDLTRRINSNSWLYDNRRDPEERYASSAKSDPWSEEQTEQFYDALRMFGTDFFIISKMFPGKTRRMIKNKFVREERSDPARVGGALIGENVPMDLTAYCEATGQEESEFKNPEQLEQELREQDEAQRADIEKQKADQVEKARSKQEAAKARADVGKARKKRTKKAEGHAGGEEVPMPGEGEVAVAGTAGQD